MSFCLFFLMDEIKCGCNENILLNINIVLILCDLDIIIY